MSEPAATPPKKQKKRRTWKQRLKIAAFVIIIAALLIRTGVNLLLPTVVRKVANAYDLDCAYDRMTLNMFNGNANIWGLTLRPKTGGDSIVRADFIHGSLSVPNLFRGRLVVYRAEVDGVDMLIDREPDGGIPLLKRFGAISSSGAPAPAKLATSGKPEPLNLQAPLRIDAVRVSHVSTTFRDRSVSPTFQTTIRTTFRLSDVGNPDQSAKLELNVDADPVLDGFIVQGNVRNTPTSLEGEFNLQLRGLHPKPAAAYLLPLGLKPIADDITVKAQATVKINVIPNTTDFAGQIAVSDIAAAANSAEWASLKSIVIDLKKLNATDLELASVKVDQGRASARRSDSGGLQIAGFELTPVAAATAPPSAAKTAPVASAASTPIAFRASLDELKLTDLQANFDDQAVRPIADLSARLDELSLKNIVFDQTHPDAAVKISGSASLPGMVKAITWTGTATPFAATKKAELAVKANGIRPTAIKPYLDPLAISSDFVNGVFTANVSASLGDKTDAKVTDIKLTDGNTTLLELPSASVKGFAVATDGLIRVEAIDVTGPTVGLLRDADGSITSVGIRYRPTTQPAAPVVVAATTKPTTQPVIASKGPQKLVLPRIQIDRTVCHDIRLQIEDRGGATTQPFSIAGTAGVELNDFVLDTTSNKPAGKPGSFNAWMTAPGFFEKVGAKGTLDPTDNGLSTTTAFYGQGLSGKLINRFLTPLGIEIILENGQLQGNLAAAVAVTDDGLSAKLDLTDVSYADGERELAGVDSVRVTGFEFKPGRINLASVEVVKPRARLTRNVDGTLQGGGIHLLPAPPAAPPASAVMVTAPAPPAPLKLPAAPIAVSLGKFSVTEGRLAFSDLTLDPVTETALHGNVRLENLSLSPKDPPATLDVSGGIDGIIEIATVRGTVVLAPDAPSAKLTITADQINAAALDGYYPPGMTGSMKGGHFTMALEAGASNHPQGGIAANVSVRDLTLEDRATNTPLAKVGAFTVRATRIDPAGELISIDELSSAGVVLDLSRNPDNTTAGLGLRFGGSARPAVRLATATKELLTTPPTTAPATTQTTVDLRALVADARRPLPLVTVRKIDLKVDRIRLSGLAGADGKPVDLANLSFYNPVPIELAGPNADQRPPLKLQIDGGISPVVRSFSVAIESAPFAGEPTLDVNVTAGGIDGKGLTDIVPQLATTLNGEGLTEGTFNSHLSASLNYGRRGPRDIDIRRGFTAMLTIKPIEFRGQPDGPVLAGVGEIHGEGIRVELLAGNVLIKTIDITKPVGRFVRDEKGLHALGFVIPLKPTTQPATQPTEVAQATPPAASPTTAPMPVQRPTGEFRIDHFGVSGIDLIFEDRATPPTMIIPLKTLDVDVRGISSQMAWTGKPLRFDMLCTADTVPLPPRRGSTVGGPTTRTDEGEGEMRELFSQVTATGRIGLKQTADGQIVPVGWAKTSVNGFELLSVRGPAKVHKVEIGGGVLDDRNDIQFREDGSIETRNQIVFTNLKMSEPANGPIQSLFVLPLPLDLTIRQLSDADDSITMAVPVTVERNTIDTNSVILPAIAAVTKVIGVSIASQPVKVVQGVGGLLGLGKDKAPEAPVELSFLPGVASLESKERVQLATLAKRLKDDKELEVQMRHQLSPADVEQLNRRANPDAGDVRQITDRLRRDKAELLARRNALAAQARAQYAAQSFAADGTVEAVQAVDRQLAQIDQSLDQFYELLKPGAANQADRRTRAACLAVATERFDLIQAALTSAGVPDVATRVRRTNPQFEPIGERGTVTIILVPKKK